MVRISTRSQDWELCDGTLCKGRELRPALSYSEALQSLERLATDTLLMNAARGLGLSLGTGRVTKLSDREVIGLLARALSSKRLHLCRAPRMSSGNSADEGDSAKPKKRPAAPVEAAKKTKKTWVEFVVLDMEGNPAAGQHYIVMLPDGSINEGKLPKSGKVRFDGIDPENSVFTLPDLDQDKWKRIS